MKIDAGWCKGMKLETPEGVDTRPTRSRVRQAICNSLSLTIAEARVLDLFAGSGSMGLELVSRGAKAATFVESAATPFQALNSNCQGVLKRAQSQGLSPPRLDCHRLDVGQFLTTYASRDFGDFFDLVWADPPYHDVLGFLSLNLVNISKILSPDSRFVLESASSENSEVLDLLVKNGFEVLKQKSYGITLVTYATLLA
jgi:16S rRNA (guanine966-N2)-methyltransferase